MTRPAARWTALIGLTVAGLIALLGLAAWLGRDNLFRYSIQPPIPFQVATKPAVPDYGQAAAWAVRPQANGAQATADTRPAVFFIHPNTSWTNRGWNVAIDDGRAARRLSGEVIPNHLMPFEGVGPAWAPRYRQATLFALLAGRPDTRDALDLAWIDVWRAFQQFQAEGPPGQPFILVGVGQGGHHAVRLLQNEISGKPPARLLVAAYVIDQAVSPDALEPSGPLADLGLCDSPDDTGCILSWVTVDAGNPRQIALALEQARRMHAGVGIGPDEQPACVNPLTGTPDATAPASANRGSASASELEPGTAPALLPGVTGAICENGLLLVDPDRPDALKPDPLDIGSFYKPSRYNLFWQALSADAARRAAAFQRATE